MTFHICLYLLLFQVDIEGHEYETISEWISSGALDRVDQIGMEVHIKTDDRIPLFLKHMEDLYALGFRVISFAPNMKKGFAKGQVYWMEVLLKKATSTLC